MGTEYAISWLAFVGLLVTWEFAVRALSVPDFILPPPSAILLALYYGLRSGLFLYHFSVTAFQTLAGFSKSDGWPKQQVRFLHEFLKDNAIGQ